jgi:hypothetical protein
MGNNGVCVKRNIYPIYSIFNYKLVLVKKKKNLHTLSLDLMVELVKFIVNI